MTDSVITQPKEVVAFGRRNASEDRIRQAEEELAKLKDPENKTVPADDDDSLNSEEKTFKKRYGDLRRHSQKMQEDMQRQIDELKTQLETTAKKEMKLPKTQEELDAWATQYPDVYKLVKTIAIQEAKQQTTGLEERMKEIDEMKRNASRERAEVELMQLHPDFDEIRESDDFHEWVAEQPSWIQQALYENDTDAKAAARAIDLYKADKNISKKKRTSDKDAASAIGTRGGRTAPNGDGTEGMIYESQIAKMSTSEYERNAEAIQNAIRNGKFVYDMSGGAR